MTWAKIDDQFHGHRKAKRAWKGHARALGLHLLAISYCAGHLTDGLVDDEFVEEKLPNAREREQVTEALVAAGLWRRVVDDGWQINDWLEYNPSREDVLDRRRRDSERKARGRQAQSARSPRGLHAESDGPVPTRPDPTKTPPLTPPQAVGDRKRDLSRYRDEVQAWAAIHLPDCNPVHVAGALQNLRAANCPEPEITPDRIRDRIRRTFPHLNEEAA
jgi:hypothetical protein